MSEQNFVAGNTSVKEQLFQIKTLSQQSASRWLLDVILDWSIITLAFVLAYHSHAMAGYFGAMLVIGNRQHALAVLAHEGAHYTIHRNRKVNDFLSNFFCFWPLLLTTDGYRRLHFQHHNNTGTSKDPELLHKKARAPQWDLPLDKKKILSYALKDIIGYSLPDLWIILSFSQPENKKLLLPVAVMFLIFINFSVALDCWWIPLIWYGSLTTTFMMFFRLRLWIEHQGTFDTQRIVLNWPVAGLLAPHKIWLHWEHHEFPTVPYHRLEKARAILNGPIPITLSILIDNLVKTAHWPSGAARDGVKSS